MTKDFWKSAYIFTSMHLEAYGLWTPSHGGAKA